jgi:general secretion pathway protein I
MKTQRGFTLLEVLIAFAIAALSLTALAQIFSNALSATERAGGTTQATLIAQSKLAQVGTTFPLEDSTQAGDEQNGFYRWQLAITPYEPPKIENPEAPVALTNLTLPLEMKKVEVTVRYNEPERVLTLNTYRTVPKKQ